MEMPSCSKGFSGDVLTARHPWTFSPHEGQGNVLRFDARSIWMSSFGSWAMISNMDFMRGDGGRML